MPEEINGKSVFTLHEVTRSIQKTIADRYPGTYWIRAEMNKLNFYHHSGHCYPELVEKSNGKVIAQMRCTLWKDDYQRINATFRQILNEPLKDGIKIMFLGSIGFHPEYGLTLRIVDIDPAYTLGDLEREKQETIQKLQKEGIFGKNKTLDLPLLPKRIAIISVQTSKGYADFLKVLEAAKASWGYTFFHLMFPSLLQGDKAILSIREQLTKIKKVKDHFDVVAIIRGGGGDIGLSCYNDYGLAREIALFPLPVLTGIGHATNETVVEMIAHENAITPTKLAEFLIQHFHDFAVPVQEARERIIDFSGKLLKDEKSKFQSEAKLLRSVIKNLLLQNSNAVRENVLTLSQQSGFLTKNNKESLAVVSKHIQSSARTFCSSAKVLLIHFGAAIKKDALDRIKRNTVELSHTEKLIQNLDPENVLRRGYSMTLLNGRPVTSVEQVKQGDELNTHLYEGNITSVVQSIEKPNQP